MSLLEDLGRKRKYGALIIRTKSQILMRYNIDQIHKFYNLYVNPEPVNAAGKRPVDEINLFTMAGDLMKGQNNNRKFWTDKLEETVSLDEIINYSNKIKVGIADIVKEYQDQKARI